MFHGLAFIDQLGRYLKGVLLGAGALFRGAILADDLVIRNVDIRVIGAG